MRAAESMRPVTSMWPRAVMPCARTVWGPTLYTNTISVAPMATIGILTDEVTKFGRSEWTSVSIALLLLSCAIGVAISYLGWRARSLVTATCYTVLGVANKMLTVLANAMVWDQRASVTGMMFLCVCLVGAAGYKQAPLQEVLDGSTAKGSGKANGRKAVYLCLLIAAGATAGLFVKANAAPLAPSTPPVLRPPSATPYMAEPSAANVAAAVPQAHLGRVKGAGAGKMPHARPRVHDQLVTGEAKKADGRHVGKHAEAKLAESKPAEGKIDGIKHADTKHGEGKHADGKRNEAKHAMGKHASVPQTPQS